MLKQPALKSMGLYISVFQNRLNRGACNMFEKYVHDLYKISRKCDDQTKLLPCHGPQRVPTWEEDNIK